MGRERPFKNVICLGHVLDVEKKKMSKSLGNIVEPMAMMEKYGADAVRWYMYSVNQPGESKRFDEKALVDLSRQNFGILLNVVSFYKMFASEKGAGDAVKATHVLDRWIMSRLAVLVKDTTEQLEAYKITEPVRAIGDFIGDLSTWYVRRSRDRFKGEDGVDKTAAIATLRTCLIELSKLMAPFAPFLAEDVYGQVGGEKESVHLEDWPVVILSESEGSSVLKEMEETRTLVTLALEQRAKVGLNVRQALASMEVALPEGKLADEYLDVLKDEVNVKEVQLKKGERAVTLNTSLTPALIREGLAREIVRRVNAMRKNAGLNIEDRILLYVRSEDGEVQKAIKEHQATLLAGTLADEFSSSSTALVSEQFEVGDSTMIIGFTKK